MNIDVIVFIEECRIRERNGKPNGAAKILEENEGNGREIYSEKTSEV